jgi:hypothetical protein
MNEGDCVTVQLYFAFPHYLEDWIDETTRVSKRHKAEQPVETSAPMSAGT